MTPNQATAQAVAPHQPLVDLEVKDASLIFNAAWAVLESDFGVENLRFPKEIFWLNGAPGAGKGTNTRFIMEYRDLAAGPILVSDLLNSPEAKQRKDAGLLVGDREVTLLVFRALLDPHYAKGVIVDGYPRSQVQVECLKLLYNKLNHLHSKHLNTPLGEVFFKPRFHIVVLFVDENESVRRQLDRGKKILEHNQAVSQSGVGELEEVRKTDLQEEAARTRYRVFKESTYHSLQSLREVFHYHYINAQAPLADVQGRIISELRYQSS
ncbi:MAG: adenylate kinase, partial [Verrucomicrobia bacterium 21-51-4]